MKSKNLVRIVAVIALLSVYSISTFAGGVKVKSGDLSALKGEKTIKITFDYTGVRVGKDSETDYVNKKVSEGNAKEPGKGDKWKQGWEGNRKTRFQPDFVELFSKTAGKKINGSETAEAKYTLVVKVVVIEPGFNVGVMKKPAYVNYEMDVVESANPSKSVCSMLLSKVPGSQYGGYDFDAGTRITEAFKLGGKQTGKFFLKNIK